MIQSQKLLVLLLLFLPTLSSAQLSFEDIYMPWLEEIQSAQVNQYVLKANTETLAKLEAYPEFKETQEIFKQAILTTQKENANKASVIGDYAYNFLYNDTYVHGLYRRVDREEYLKAKDLDKYDHLQWEAVLDTNTFLKNTFPSPITQPAMGSWSCHYEEESKNLSRCAIGVNQSGGDRNMFYEFDFNSKSFVKTNSFNFEYFGRSSLKWVDINTVIVHLDKMSYQNQLQPENQITDAEAIAQGLLTRTGYPRSAYLWYRGDKFSTGHHIYTADKNATWVSVSSYKMTKHSPSNELFVIYEGIDNIKYKVLLKHDLKGNGSYITTELPLPELKKIMAITNSKTPEVILALDQDWKTFLKDDIISVKVNINKKTNSISLEEPELIFRNTSSDNILGTSFFIDGEEYNSDDDRLIVKLSKNVSDEALILSRDRDSWKQEILNDPLNLKYKSMNIGYNENTKETTLNISNFITPNHKYKLETVNDKLTYTLLEKNPDRFDTANLTIDQLWVDQGKDQNGKHIKVPYYVVYDKTKVSLENNKVPAPTLISAYGGFSVGYNPFYLGTSIGKIWLSKGGVYVLANIRGGDEFGTYWHTSALKENRVNSYNDIIAVSEDLIKRNISSPAKLALSGGSNGGLLVGAAFTLRPDLYKALVSSVPLLDMSRYHKLLVGSSWMDEYGDPEGTEKEFWKKYSPLHNIDKAKKYPSIFVKTNRYDDRVHPAHARKFSYRLKELGIDHFFYEDLKGGHGGQAMNSDDQSYRYTLEYVYLYQQLGM